jgi:hypothetical protein
LCNALAAALGIDPARDAYLDLDPLRPLVADVLVGTQSFAVWAERAFLAQGFRLVRGGPHPDQLTLGAMAQSRGEPGHRPESDWRLHNPEWSGITRETAEAHERSLQRLREAIPEMGLHPDALLTRALPQIAAHLEAKYRLNPATTMKWLADVVAALKLRGLNLAKSPRVADLFRALRKRVARPAANRPRPYVTPIEARAVFTSLLAQNEEFAMLHDLTWVSARRPSNVLALETANVVDVSPDGLSLTWTAAKTVAARCPFTTFASTRAYPELREWILARLDAAKVTQLRSLPLFPVLRQRQARTLAAYRNAVRAVRPDCDLRSLRRGTVIAMAEAGVPEGTLLHLTGHASVANLYRYLSWGRYNREAQQALQAQSV